MSLQNVDVVREQFEATNEQDFARAMTYYADEVVLVVPPDAFLNSGTFEGREAVGEWFGDWFRTFRSVHFEFDLRDLGDVVYLRASYSGRGRSSGVEVDDERGYLYTVRNGKIVRAELFSSPAQALEAAGIRTED
jgi:ketosteroid isomerase-like protein